MQKSVSARETWNEYGPGFEAMPSLLLLATAMTGLTSTQQHTSFLEPPGEW